MTQGSLTTSPYPDQLAALLGGTYTVYNVGRGGIALTTMVGDFAARMAPLFNAAYTRCVIVMFETRGQASNGDTAAQILQSHADYVTLAKAAGFRVIVCTAPPCGAGNPGAAAHAAATLLIRSQALTTIGAHGFVDLDACPEFTPAGNATYYMPSDSVHPNNAGNAVMAVTVRPAL